MKIPRTRFTQADGCINQGPKAGSRRFYRDALYSTLEYLKPKTCLEIGTHYGGSSAVFQEYFNNLMPDGLLVTCDIHRYTTLNMPNVKQVLVYPHTTRGEVEQWHSVELDKMLPDAFSHPDRMESSHNLNTQILREFGPFDFCFLDGDHTALSVTRDFIIAAQVLKEPQYILFDDTDEFEHPACPQTLAEMKTWYPKKYNIYEFEDWDCAVGAALIYNYGVKE